MRETAGGCILLHDHSLPPSPMSPRKATGITERAAPEVRVAVVANFNGFCHPFGITVEKGKQYELSEVVVGKYNKEFKTKSGDEPFKVIKKLETKKAGTLERDTSADAADTVPVVSQETTTKVESEKE